MISLLCLALHCFGCFDCDGLLQEHLLWNHDEIVSVFREYPGVVVAYFAGHFHPGGYYFDEISKTHHMTFRAILESHDKGEDKFNSYGIVEVYQNQFNIIGYGWAKEQSASWKFE